MAFPANVFVACGALNGASPRGPCRTEPWIRQPIRDAHIPVGSEGWCVGAHLEGSGLTGDSNNDSSANNRAKDIQVHTFLTPGYSPVRYNTRGARYGGLQVRYGRGVDLLYDQGLDEHSSLTQKSLKIKENGLLGQIFSACGAL